MLQITKFFLLLPTQLINSAVMTNSARSTATDSLADDCWSHTSNYKTVPRTYVSANQLDGYRSSNTVRKSRMANGSGSGGKETFDSSLNVGSSEYSRNRVGGSHKQPRRKSHSNNNHHRANLNVVAKFPNNDFL